MSASTCSKLLRIRVRNSNERGRYFNLEKSSSSAKRFLHVIRDDRRNGERNGSRSRSFLAFAANRKDGARPGAGKTVGKRRKKGGSGIGW